MFANCRSAATIKETSVRGEILSYDAVTGAGLISGDDGARYDFTSDAL